MSTFLYIRTLEAFRFLFFLLKTLRTNTNILASTFLYIRTLWAFRSLFPLGVKDIEDLFDVEDGGDDMCLQVIKVGHQPGASRIPGGGGGGDGEEDDDDDDGGDDDEDDDGGLWWVVTCRGW